MMLVCHRHLMLSSLSKASRTCLCYLTTFHYCFAPCFLSLTPAVTALAWRTIFLIPKTLQLNKLIFRKTTESWNYQRLENILIEISSEWKGKVFSFPFLTFLFIYSPILCFNSATPWTHQALLSFPISWDLLKLMSIESVMPFNHLIHCHPFLLLPSIFPNHQDLFQWVSYSHQVAKVLELQH